MRLLGGAVFPMQNACTGPCISLQVACTEGSLQCVAEGVQPSPCKMHARGDLCSTVQGGAAFPVPNAHAGPCTMHAQGWAVQLHARGTESHTPPPPHADPCRALLQKLLQLSAQLQSSDTEKEEVQFAAVLCAKIREDPALLPLLLEVRSAPLPSACSPGRAAKSPGAEREEGCNAWLLLFLCRMRAV